MPFVVFPGQGSQSVGMARAAAARDADATATIDTASTVLGLDMRALLWSSDPETLRRTENAQPAIVTASIAVFRAWRSDTGRPDLDWVSGHSVGALSAAIAAGAMTFEDGIALTRRRGQLMASAPGEGGMIAVAVTSPASLESATDVASRLGLSVACRNGDRQVVLSGDIVGVHAAREALGARSAVLDVSHGFHSPLMDPILADWASAVAETSITDPVVPCVSGRTGERLLDAAAIANDLTEGLRSPVRWDLVGDVADQSSDGVVIGEGTALARMWRGRSSSKQLRVYNGERVAVHA